MVGGEFRSEQCCMKGVFAMVLHFRCGFLTAWIPLKRFTLAVWRLAWCFQFLVESGCGFGHFQNSFVELVFLRFAINACGQQQQQCIYNSGFIAIGACVFTTVVYLCIYLQMSVFFHIYIFDDGIWQMVFKRGRGNFHLSQMSFYCDENICEFLVTFTSQRYSLWGVLWLLSGAQHFYWFWYGFVVHGWRTTDFTCFCNGFWPLRCFHDLDLWLDGNVEVPEIFHFVWLENEGFWALCEEMTKVSFHFAFWLSKVKAEHAREHDKESVSDSSPFVGCGR